MDLKIQLIQNEIKLSELRMNPTIDFEETALENRQAELCDQLRREHGSEIEPLINAVWLVFHKKGRKAVGHFIATLLRTACVAAMFLQA